MAGSASSARRASRDERALLVRGRGRATAKDDVRPVEPGGHPQRVAQPEPWRDVGRHARRGGGRGGHDRHGSQRARGVRQTEVVGAEVVPPLRDAVGLINHEEPDPGATPCRSIKPRAAKRSGAT